MGKSGLRLVLTGQGFEPTDSTHGRKVEVFETQEILRPDGAKEIREILLWDLAGQPGYRLIHQLSLTEVAVALVVYDSRSETDPFAGVRYWSKALLQAARAQRSDLTYSIKKFLVAGRIDRGRVGVTRGRIEALTHELHFHQCFETSARDGTNISELRGAIKSAIDWISLPRISSTDLFEEIKSFLMEHKQQRFLLTSEPDLYKLFLSRSGYEDSETLLGQFATCITLVEARGLIRRLSFGSLVLLQPELLDAYASAIVNSAKDEPDGLGSINEADVRACRFRISTDERIGDRNQEQLLLIATIEDLIRHEITLREPPDLVFPAQITRTKPDLTDAPGRTTVFRFEGAISNIIAVQVS